MVLLLPAEQFRQRSVTFGFALFQHAVSLHHMLWHVIYQGKLMAVEEFRFVRAEGSRYLLHFSQA